MTPFKKCGSKLARLSYHIQFFVKVGNVGRIIVLEEYALPAPCFFTGFNPALVVHSLNC